MNIIYLILLLIIILIIYLIKIFNKTSSVIEPIKKCRLSKLSSRNDVAIGFPRNNNRLKTIGTVIAKVIFVDFPDAISTKSPEKVFSNISNAPDLFTEMSYDNFKLIFEPTYKWYRMSKNSLSYSPLNKSYESHRIYIEEAINLVKTDINFSNADTIIILSNPDAVNIGQPGPMFVASNNNGFTLNGKYISNIATSGHDFYYWGYMWLNHELGHGLGLPDLYPFNSDTSYVGEYSYMGLINGNAPGLFAWERWLLGWLNDDQIVCFNNNSTFFITPIERKGGIKAIIISISLSKVVVVECRRKEGIDKNMKKEGSLVYVVDSSINTGNGPIKIYPSNSSDFLKQNSPLAIGESVSLEGFNIKVSNSSNEGDLIEILKI